MKKMADKRLNEVNQLDIDFQPLNVKMTLIGFMKNQPSFNKITIKEKIF